MLPLKERLKLKSDFELVFKRGKVFQDSFFKVYVCQTDFPGRRIGFSVSKKVSKKAVVRNRLKRQMREIYRTWQESVKSGYFILIVAKKSCLEISFFKIKERLYKLLKKANIYEQEYPIVCD